MRSICAATLHTRACSIREPAAPVATRQRSLSVRHQGVNALTALPTMPIIGESTTWGTWFSPSADPAHCAGTQASVRTHSRQRLGTSDTPD